MSVSIEFPNGASWFKANWAFRQLATDVVHRFPEAEIQVCLEEAQAFGLLDFRTMQSSLSSRLMYALRTIADDTLSGVVSGWRPEDRSGHEMYREAMSELLATIRSQDSEMSK
jgi:hypothetical protein